MLRAWTAVRLAVFCVLVLCATSRPSAAIDDGISVNATYGLSVGDVGLTWTGGAPPYRIFRGPDARLLFSAGNQIGTTSGTIWNDTPPPGSVFYYAVGGAGCAPSVEVCDASDNDCDGVTNEQGAELSCSSFHATSICSSFMCQVASCDSGWANCDSDANTGCETPLDVHSNAPPGEFLGTYDADSLTGTSPLCSNPGCQPVLSRAGVAGRYFSIRALESSNCCAYVGMRFDLLVPAGVDYDLYISGPCFADPGFSSTLGPGQTETIVVWCNDDCFAADDSFTANVEVRYAGGVSCQPWTLQVYRRNC